MGGRLLSRVAVERREDWSARDLGGRVHDVELSELPDGGGDGTFHLIALHQMQHLGQVADARRAAGREPFV